MTLHFERFIPNDPKEHDAKRVDRLDMNFEEEDLGLGFSDEGRVQLVFQGEAHRKVGSGGGSTGSTTLVEAFSLLRSFLDVFTVAPQLGDLFGVCLHKGLNFGFANLLYSGHLCRDHVVYVSRVSRVGAGSR